MECPGQWRGGSAYDEVRALAVAGDGSLYAGGAFTSPASRVAKWDGTTWRALGSGANGKVWALALAGGAYLFAGGDFTSAGGKPSAFIGLWTGQLYPGIWDPTGYCMDPSTSANTGHVGRCSGQYIWMDAQGDERTDFYSPDTDLDIREFRVTADGNNLYFRILMRDIVNTARPYVGIAVDTTMNSSGEDDFGDYADTKVGSSALWEREIVANLNKTGYYDTGWTWHNAGIQLHFRRRQYGRNPACPGRRWG